MLSISRDVQCLVLCLLNSHNRYYRMKLLFFSIALTFFTLTTCDVKYTDRYDNININEIVANKRLLTAYIKCILDMGRCTAEGKELKVHITDAMQTACQKCTEKQRKGARQVVKHIRENEPEYWKQMLNKFDPNDEYKSIYEPFLESND